MRPATWLTPTGSRCTQEMLVEVQGISSESNSQPVIPFKPGCTAHMHGAYCLEYGTNGSPRRCLMLEEAHHIQKDATIGQSHL